MAPERNGAAVVIAQEGSHLRVEHDGKQLTVPMQGFPPAFEVRPGGRVILFDDPAGLVARPLVRAITARLPPDGLKGRDGLEIEGQRLEIQPSTILEDRRPGGVELAAEEYVLWVVERGAGKPANQLVAARRRL